MCRIWVKKSYSFKEAKEFDQRFWQQAGSMARFAAAWGMVIEWIKMKGRHGDKPRLRRTVHNIKRI